MKQPGSQWSTAFAGASMEAMRVYDQTIARLFTPWAHDLIERLSPAPGVTALDIACGPGTVALPLAARIGPEGKVIASDISPAMLDIARAKPVAQDAAPIEWIESSAVPLPVEDASVDIITCQQGLQFFPDKVESLAEMRRALRAGATAGVAVWTRIDDQPFFAALHQAIGKVVSEELASRYTGPWLLSGEEASAHARAAGFTSVDLQRVTLPAVIEGGATELFNSLAAAGIASDIAALDKEKSQALQDELARLTEPLRDGDAIRSTLTSSVLILQ